MTGLGIIIGVLASAFAAVAILIGAKYVLQREVSEAYRERLARILAFGSGALLTALCLDLLPDAWASNANTAAWWMFGGILLLWGVTTWVDGAFQAKVIVRGRTRDDGIREGGGVEFDTGNEDGLGGWTRTLTKASAIVLAISLSFHTFVEGTALAASLRQVDTASITFAVAIVLHKLPEGVLWALALQSVFPITNGQSKRFLLKLLSIPALCTLVGTLCGMFLVEIAPETLVAAMSALLVGALLYICLSELFPALREASQSVRYTGIGFIVGVVVMLVPILIGASLGG
jgi:zinc transporter ZupT